MKTPKELSKIYNRLPKDKTELAKVELGIVDDLGKAMSKLEKTANDEKEYQKLAKENNSEVKDLIKIIKKAETSRNKLMDRGEKIEKQSDEIYDEVNNILEKATKAAKELGVKPESIANFKKAEGLLGKILTVNPQRDFIDNIYF
tara:strand:+ start:135 stop:569 length:435 start_codon:yes stop_codon:yes gene_type:complete